MKIFPKLNICLNVLPSKETQMHSIFSRFVLAGGDLYDEMEVRFGRDGFRVSGNFDFPMEENLIFKAKECLKEVFPSFAKELDNIQVEVQKKIPCGSGLGGGSADAAGFMLRVASEFGIPKQDLINIAPKVGSDVGFFVSQYPSANVSGIGEIIEEFIEDRLSYEIYTPSFACQTKAVYEAFDRFAPSCKKADCEKSDFLNCFSLDLLNQYRIEELNDLYLPATKIYPELLEIAKDLGDQWFFSGSGSSFFRICQ